MTHGLAESQRLREKDHGHVTPLLMTLVTAVHGACLLAFIAVLRAPTAQFPGWRVVRPGGMHGSCFVGRWAFATLVSWVWLFVGSARRDAEAQMRWALLLIFAFDIASAVSGFLAQLRRRGLRKALRQVGWYPASHIREHMPTQSRRS